MIISRSIARFFIQKHQIRTLIRKPPPDTRDASACTLPWSPYEQISDQEKYKDYFEDPLEFRREDGFEIIKKAEPSWIKRYIEKTGGNELRRYSWIKKLQLMAQAKNDKFQMFDDEKVGKLGPDIAAANVVWKIKGAVKFNGREGFHTSKKSEIKLPRCNDESIKIEGIDLSNTEIKHEGLRYLNGLKYLRWINLENCKNIDNWCIDRISLYAPNLEFINLKGCSALDHNVVACFYRFQNLNSVYIDHQQGNLFTFAFLNLEAEIPHIVIQGIRYKKPPKSVFN